MSSALINHPAFGSLWLERAELVKVDGREFVVGEMWDDSDVGHPNLPDDYQGRYEPMKFPATCVRRWSPS